MLKGKKFKSQGARELADVGIRIVGSEGKYREWTDEEKKPFGAHKYVTLNGDRKAIELKGIMVGTSVFYETTKGKKFVITNEM